ncbi:ATP-binding protein [Deinococcus sp. UYEF24]
MSARAGVVEYLPTVRAGLGLQWRLFLLQAAVIGFLVVLLGVALTLGFRRYTESEFGQRALIGSRTVAVLPSVIQALERGILDPQVNVLANTIRRQVGADFIVIADRRGIRWSHPRPDHVGRPLTGTNNNEPPHEDDAPMHGHEQISVSKGSLGTSIRAKVPVFAPDGTVLGLVSTGYLIPTVMSSAARVTLTLWPWFGIGLTLALLGSMWVSRRIKRELLQLEPAQIAGLVQQHRAVLDALQEGVLMIAPDGSISAANPLATRMLGLEHRVKPLLVSVLWPALAESGMLHGQRRHAGGHPDLLLALDSTPVLVRSMPCGDGRVVTFRDRAEFTRIAEELTHSKELTDLLRTQSHEFMNRLHTIAGLIHLGRSAEALRLISDQAEHTSDVRELLAGIEVPAVAALIIGKVARAQERRVQLILEGGSSLSAAWEDIGGDVLVPVIGNLLENAFEAAGEHQPIGAAQVRLMIGEDPQGLEIEVRDNGAGVPAAFLDRSSQAGAPGRFSTHGPGRGYGLPLVRRTLAAMGGTLDQLRRGDQTIFRVNLPNRELPKTEASSRAPLDREPR